MKIDYRKQLNEEQAEVVFNGSGQVLVLAGAGSGKTRTLVYRVAYLIEQGISPENILLLTFTVKAAKEMLSRVSSLLGVRDVSIWSGTFHHIANRMLRRHSDCTYGRKNYSILDDEDSRTLISQCIRDIAGKGTKGLPNAGFISYVYGLSVNTMEPVKEIIVDRFADYSEYMHFIDKVIALYEERKAEANAFDFDDLLKNTLRLLDENASIREYYSRKFKYILVDEYQDTSRIQAAIVDRLAEHHQNILVVGDDAQSIYSFRGATVENIISFQDRYKGCKVFYLKTNYRSCPEILSLANCSIANNTRGYKKDLVAVRERGGEMPLVAQFNTNDDEARFIAQMIEAYRDEGTPLNDIAVLFRSGFHAAKLELALASRGIPYVMRGGVRFFEQAHIKDVLSWLRVVHNPKDKVAWMRLLCMLDGIGPQTAIKLSIPLEEYLLSGREPQGKWGNKAAGALSFACSMFREAKDKQPSEFARCLLTEFYLSYMRQAYDDYTNREDDLFFLLDFLRGYETYEDVFSDVAIQENSKGDLINSDGVILSTIHQAKGLEWDVVFVMGVVDGQFPHHKSMNSYSAVEEERRLFYVAVTRAKKSLIITSPVSGFDYRYGASFKRGSIFIEELPLDTFKLHRDAALMYGGYY